MIFHLLLTSQSFAQTQCVAAACSRFDKIVVKPGTQPTLTGAEFFLSSSQATCDPTVYGILGGAVPDIDMVTSYTQFYGALSVTSFPIELDIDVPADVDASLTGTDSVQWGDTDTCLSNLSYMCVVPNGDFPTYTGPSIFGTPHGTYLHTMDDTSADFEHRNVRENHNLNYTDGCYEKAVGMGVEHLLTLCTPLTGLTGWTTALDSNNNTAFYDSTGYREECVNEYRALSVAPCTASAFQPMQMACTANSLTEWITYDVSTIFLRIGSTTVGSRKTSTIWQDFTWP